MKAAAELQEIALADAVRAEYLMEGASKPYMEDVVRAFRITKGAQIYIEVGTQDRGNIAWIARTKLAPGATIIDVDFGSYPKNEAKIAGELAESGFDYHSIHGDCLSDAVVNQVKEILGQRLADFIFCDSHYTAEHTLTEFALYWPLVRPGGALLFHDAQWPGDAGRQWEEERKTGKLRAIVEIDRFYPVYAVLGPQAPPYRFVAPFDQEPYWGTLAVIPKLA